MTITIKYRHPWAELKHDTTRNISQSSRAIWDQLLRCVPKDDALRLFPDSQYMTLIGGQIAG